MECFGCEGSVADGEEGTVWLDTPLGITAVKTHREQVCAAAAVRRYSEQPAKRIKRPETKEEKVLRRAGGG